MGYEARHGGVMRRVVYGVLTVAAILWLAACTSNPAKPSGMRLYFSDDLRVHSLRADGTDPLEFSGKPTSSPVPGPENSILCSSYRGPYFLFDPLRPGIYRTDWRGHHRHRLADWDDMAVLCGYSSQRSELVFLSAASPDSLQVLSLGEGGILSISLPSTAVAAAVDPTGERAALILKPRLRKVTLGDREWLTEGSDLLVIALAGGEAATTEVPAFPMELKTKPDLESYAGAGMSAICWRDAHQLLLSSAPGLWVLDLRDPSLSIMMRGRITGAPAADGLDISPDGQILAFTCGGRLILRDLITGQERDVTPTGLVGGAHHPRWMAADGGK
jgi:hypothetical protein